MPTNTEMNGPLEDEENTVDRFLLALQKTVSRVSRDSSTVPASQARSLIVGNVDFEVDLKCSLATGDKLKLDNAGGTPLKMKGQIATDIGMHLLESEDEQRPRTAVRKRKKKKDTRSE